MQRKNNDHIVLLSTTSIFQLKITGPIRKRTWSHRPVLAEAPVLGVIVVLVTRRAVVHPARSGDCHRQLHCVSRSEKCQHLVQIPEKILATSRIDLRVKHLVKDHQKLSCGIWRKENPVHLCGMGSGGSASGWRAATLMSKSNLLHPKLGVRGWGGGSSFPLTTVNSTV